MARLIPPVIGDETSSPGERELFRRFQSEVGSDGWAVLHSLDVPGHRRQLMGEIDFLIAVPRLGILCLEVKSHKSVRRDPDGMWHLGQDPPTRIGPFRQASDAMHSLREYVAARAPDLAGTLFWSAVCFTSVPFSLTSPAEWHEWQVIDVGRLRAHSLPELIVTVLQNARRLASATKSATWFHPESGAPTAADIDKLVKILRPAFEFYESPKSRRRQRDDELRLFTAEQYTALDAMASNPRVLFEGPAGTGKTLLALEEARRAVQRRERVLLCCFNRLLGNWLKKEAEPLGSEAVTSTFHSFMLHVTRRASPVAPSSTFWERELPEAALEWAMSQPGPPFDLLIVDEAQDLLRDCYLDVFDALVDGGLSEGKWRMFGDFERQAIYDASSAPAAADLLSGRARGFPRFRLIKNCRNPPRIASLVKLLAAYEHGYPDVLRPDNGIEPQILYYGSDAHQDRMLLDILNQLCREGYSTSEIVLLSPRAQGSAAQRIVDPVWVGRVKPAQPGPTGGVRYCTVHAFKGLESPVVVVTDISSIGTEADQKLFYTAVTRATERLYILASSQLKSIVIGLLLNQGSTRSLP